MVGSLRPDVALAVKPIDPPREIFKKQFVYDSTC
jgi:hypothetical protein